MPVMNGLELYKQMKKINPSLKGILMSTSELKYINDLELFGFLFQKNYDIFILLEKIQELMH